MVRNGCNEQQGSNVMTEFKITRIETVKGTSHLYIEAEFYVDSVLTHIEDFIIGRPAEKRVYTGSVGPDDEILDPNAYLTESLDIKQEILDVIRGFERAHRGDGLLTGERTVRTSQVKTDQSDPNGFLGRAEVQELKNRMISLQSAQDFVV